MDRSIERRACHRFRFLVPVLFRWADSVEHYDVGHSGNVGLGGIFIFTSKCPPVGTQVEIEFTIPAFDRIPSQASFRCNGQVTRVETCYEVAGFAVAGRIEENVDNLATTSKKWLPVCRPGGNALC